MAGQKRPWEHIKVQQAIKKQDGYECEICGAISQTAQGHHVIPYRDAGPADLSNMMTLCVDCHRAYHSGKIQVDIWRF